MKIDLQKGDITKLSAEAIVNAANSSLMGGGGVDGAIHRAGGSAILEECKLWVQQNGPLPAGKAMLTTAGNMPSKYVIHTVGPIWKNGLKNEDALLADCYINALHLCLENDIRTVAFPNISTGVYGYPKQEAAEVAVTTIQNFLSSLERQFRVVFVCFDNENYHIYQRLLGIEEL